MLNRDCEIRSIDRQLVFIGGLHRSGTSLLARLVGQHPDASNLSHTGVIEDEGQFLQDVLPVDSEHGGPGRFAFSPELRLTESDVPPEREDVAARMVSRWLPFWDMKRRLFVEKSPPNLIRARFLQELFPRAAFIFITRHPVAVSLATQKWSNTSLHSLLAHWLHAHDIMMQDIPLVRRSLCISYEELVEDPEATLKRVFSFLDLALQSVGPLQTVNYNKGYFKTWTQIAGLSPPIEAREKVAGQSSVLERSSALAKKALRNTVPTPLVLSVADLRKEIWDSRHLLEPRMNDFGYSLNDLDAFPRGDAPKRTKLRQKSDDLLVFEPDVAGHRAHYINLLVRHSLRACEGTVNFAINPAILPRLDEDVSRILTSEQGCVRFVPVADGSFDRRKDRYLIQSRKRWKLATDLASGLKARRLLFLLVDDVIAGATVAAPTDILISGIYFRPSMHYPEYRTSPAANIRQMVKSEAFKTLLRREDIERIWSFDPYFLEFARQRYWGGAKVRVLPEPFDDQNSDAPPISGSGSIRFLLFGVLQGRKGVRELLEAAALLREDTRKRSEIRICGDGELAGLVKRRVSELTRAGYNVTFRQGYISDVDLDAEIRAANVILAPYRDHIGSSGVIYQAAAYRKPVIAPASGLVGRQVRDFQLGLTVDTTDSRTIAAAIEEYTSKLTEGGAQTVGFGGYRKFTAQAGTDAFVRLLMGDDRKIANGRFAREMAAV